MLIHVNMESMRFRPYDISMRPDLWFVNKNNKKPQKIFQKPKKHSKTSDYFVDFI